MRSGRCQLGAQRLDLLLSGGQHLLMLCQCHLCRLLLLLKSSCMRGLHSSHLQLYRCRGLLCIDDD